MNNLYELAKQYVGAVIAGRDAFRTGNVPLHNRWWRRRDRIARAIIDRGQGGTAVIEALLSHPVPSVRLSAASYVLKWAPSMAVPVLEELLLWAKRDRSRELFGEALQVLSNVHGLLAQHYGIDALDVDAHVLRKRGGPQTS